VLTLRFDMRTTAFGAPTADLNTAALEVSAWADDHCAAAIVLSEHQTRWFRLDHPLPRTASGKVLKHEVRNLFNDDPRTEQV
jgi:acyl-coenzyme A synthetase/AMP-(fatty) acid ligase